MKFKCEYNQDDYLKVKKVEEGIQFEVFENEMPNFVILNLENINFLIMQLKKLKGEFK